jgi:hypothetical protein
MNVTAEEVQAAKRGEAVRLTADDVEVVLLRADLYDRIKGVIYDDSPLTPEERLALIQQAGNRAGWDDPELDVYEQYRQ